MNSSLSMEPESRTPPKRGWLADIVIGGIIGGGAGAIAAVNFVIYFGIEGGYEATIPEVFRQSAFAGVVTVTILIAGPIVGVWLARRARQQRQTKEIRTGRPGGHPATMSDGE